MAYLIRHNSLTPVHVDAHSLFSEASRAAADPVPPQFLDGTVCRMATECNSTTGEVSTSLGAPLDGAGCRIVTDCNNTDGEVVLNVRDLPVLLLQQGAGEVPLSRAAWPGGDALRSAWPRGCCNVIDRMIMQRPRC